MNPLIIFISAHSPLSMPTDNPSFFKVMIGDFKTAMRIPPMFNNHLIGNVRRMSVLRTAGGRKWRVKTQVSEGQVFFLDGWERFVSDHKISNGDFLVFFYDGNSGFDVKLYGTTCCEKKECHPPPPLKLVKIESESESESGSDSDKEEDPTLNCSPKISRKRKGSVKMDDTLRSSQPKGSELCYKVMRSARPADNERAKKAACDFHSPYPHFITACRSSRTSYMTIPKELADEYNLDQKDLIVLRDPRGTPFSVKLSSWRDGRRCLSTGWSHLYKKNHLKEGDICVFEFVPGGTIANVHIFRAAEYNGKSIPESDSKPSPDTCAISIPDPCAKLIPESGDRLLPQAKKKRVRNAATSSESNDREFTIVWRLTRLYHVPIPKRVAMSLGLCSNQRTILYDPSGKSWPINIIVRSYGQVSLGVGWSSCARGNNLAIGDVCGFEFLEGAEAVKLSITRAGQTDTSAADVQAVTSDDDAADVQAAADAAAADVQASTSDDAAADVQAADADAADVQADTSAAAADVQTGTSDDADADDDVQADTSAAAADVQAGTSAAAAADDDVQAGTSDDAAADDVVQADTSAAGIQAGTSAAVADDDVQAGTSAADVEAGTSDAAAGDDDDIQADTSAADADDVQDSQNLEIPSS